MPSFSEYDAVQYRKVPTAPPPAPSFEVAGLGPGEGLDLVQSGLRRAAALINSGNLEAVRALLREPAFMAFLSYTPGVRGNAANLKPPAALVASGLDASALQDLLLDLKRLDDWCLSNRVIVFNQEDIAQVKELMAASGRDGSEGDRLDLDEAWALLADAQGSLKAAMQSPERP